jgi:hypothetical protein
MRSAAYYTRRIVVYTVLNTTHANPNKGSVFIWVSHNNVQMLFLVWARGHNVSSANIHFIIKSKIAIDS